MSTQSIATSDTPELLRQQAMDSLALADQFVRDHLGREDAQERLTEVCEIAGALTISACYAARSADLLERYTGQVPERVGPVAVATELVDSTVAPGQSDATVTSLLPAVGLRSEQGLGTVGETPSDGAHVEAEPDQSFQERIEERNAHAIAEYGSDVCIVEILDNGEFRVNGQLTSAESISTVKDPNSVTALVKFMLDKRGEEIQVHDIREILGLEAWISPSPTMHKIQEKLSDQRGNSLISIDRVHAKKLIYGISPNVVVGSITEQESGASYGVSASAGEKSDKKVEIAIVPGALIINGRSFELYPGEDEMLAQMQLADRPMNALEVEQSRSNKEIISEAVLNASEADLFNMYKRGLLTWGLDIHKSSQYDINEDAGEFMDAGVELEVDGESVFLSEQDLRIISILKSNGGGLTLKEISSKLSPNQRLDLASASELAKTVKTYLVGYGVVDKIDSGMDRGSNRYLLTDAWANSLGLEVALAELPALSEPDNGQQKFERPQAEKKVLPIEESVRLLLSGEDPGVAIDLRDVHNASIARRMAMAVRSGSSDAATKELCNDLLSRVAEAQG